MSVSFTTHFVAVNQLAARGFQGWAFLPGMLFAAKRVWWQAPEPAARPRPHEGVDLATFSDSAGALHYLAAGTKVPVLADGEVVAIFADFLGQSILVAHGRQRQGEAMFYSLYAHLRAEAEITVGHLCHGGEVIGRIAPCSRGRVPPHLHLSTLWLTGTINGVLSWPRLNDMTALQFCDPLELIGGQASTPICL